MSIAIMTEVWKDAPVAGTELLMLLALADSANDDRECWPSMRHLQHKVRVSESQARKLIKGLQLQGLIEVVRNGGKGTKGRESNLYKIVPTPITQDTSASPSTPITGDTSTPITQDTLNRLNESSIESSILSPSGDDVDEKPKKEREHDPIFDAVAEHVFGISLEQLNGTGVRVGILAAWLNGKSDGVKHGKSKVTVGFISAPAKPEHVAAFASYWKSTSRANIPYDLVKFVDAWRKWVTGLKGNTDRRESQKKAAIPEMNLSDDEAESRKQQLAAARKGEQSS